MINKTIFIFGLLGSNAMAGHLKGSHTEEHEHLDLEVMVEGERQLFPLLPGTKCPPGFTCRSRSTTPVAFDGQLPIISSLKKVIDYKTPLAMTLDFHELNDNFKTVVEDGGYCNRRNAMKRAAGLLAGASIAAVNQPAYAASTANVKMGADSGLLVFEPNKIKICAGDSVKWTMNKAGPHNVVFDEDNVPSGVDPEKISMEEGVQIGDEGDTFVTKLDKAGEYGYYCEPHRGAGMTASITVG